MCRITNAVHECGHLGAELQRDRCMFFEAAVTLIIRQTQVYNKDIEAYKRDCLSTSRETPQPIQGPCSNCTAVAANAHLDASGAKTSSLEEAIEAFGADYEDGDDDADADDASEAQDPVYLEALLAQSPRRTTANPASSERPPPKAPLAPFLLSPSPFSLDQVFSPTAAAAAAATLASPSPLSLSPVLPPADPGAASEAAAAAAAAARPSRFSGRYKYSVEPGSMLVKRRRRSSPTGASGSGLGSALALAAAPEALEVGQKWAAVDEADPFDMPE